MNAAVLGVAGGLAVLVIAVAAAALHFGWVEGTATVKVVPPWKRNGPEPKAAPKGEAQTAERGVSS